MMRGVFGLVSLLIVAVGAVLYFQETSPVAQQQTYQNIETQADKAAATMAKSYDKAQAQVEAATGETPANPATNTPPVNN